MQFNSKKILIVAPHFYPLMTGYSNATGNLTKDIDKYSENIQFTVLCNDTLGDHAEISFKNGSIVRVKMSRYLPKSLSFLFLEIKLFIKILSLDRQKPYDFILFETMERSFCLFLVSRSRLARKVGIRIHGCTETEFYMWSKQIQFRVRSLMSSLAVKNIKYIFSTNPFYLDFFKKHYLRGDILQIARRNFYVLENLMSEDIKPSGGDLVAERLGLRTNKFFLSVGRMDLAGVTQKGFADLLQAVFLLSVETPKLLIDCRFVFVGEGEYMNKLSTLAKGLKIDTYCLFLPKLINNDILALQPLARGVVMSSRFEGLSMFALEALCRGSLLLFSDVGGLRDLIDDGVNGYYVEPQNIVQLKEKISDILMLSGDKIEKMKQGSQILYGKKFNPKDIVQKFDGIIEFIKQDAKVPVSL